MELPASYANGFAPRDGEPLFPELWKDCVFAANPGLGPSGQVLRDWSGRGNHGTLTNGPTWVPGAIQTSGATSAGVLVFPAGSFVPANMDCGLLQNWTMSAWVSRGAIASYPMCMSYGYFGASLGVAHSGTKIEHWRNNSTNTLGTTDLPQNTPVHIALVNTGTTVRIYFNGRLDKTQTGLASVSRVSGGFAVQNAPLGASLGSVSFSGKCTDFRFYSSAVDSIMPLLATRPGIAYELAPSRYAGETASSYRRRLQAAQLASCGVIG